ncbi:uncharacterized protein LOC129928616 [Biomphalaria glabrata]|uniref:Uncharacterized protein LOC129928616 n=1 Tax=Biomphalaria glabrata TaxID=6526 RepID=A0A9W3BJ11_BIOGL|nr:uncharacterized protein LOC129928616 [Biomphalaria glabrata]
MEEMASTPLIPRPRDTGTKLKQSQENPLDHSLSAREGQFQEDAFLEKQDELFQVQSELKTIKEILIPQLESQLSEQRQDLLKANKKCLYLEKELERKKYQPAAKILSGRDQCTQTVTSRIPQCKPDYKAPVIIDVTNSKLPRRVINEAKMIDNSPS